MAEPSSPQAIAGDALPKTGLGKVRRRLLAQMAGSD